MAARRRISLSKKFAFAAVTTLTVLSIPELYLRVMLFEVSIPPPASVCAWIGADHLMGDRGYFLQPDPHCFYDIRAGARYSHFNTRMEMIEEAGFRGPADLSPAEGKLRIVSLGDSSTFGMCVEEPDTWCRQLERRLRLQAPNRTIEVLNAGVIGYTVYQGLQKYRHKISPLRPAFTIVAFGAINEKMPTTGGTDYERAANWPSAYFEHGGQSLRWIWHLRTAQWIFQDRLEMQRDRFRRMHHQGNLAYFSFERGEPYQPRMSDQEFRECLAALVDAIEHDGGKVVLVNPHRRPSAEQTYPQVLPLSKIILDLARERQILFFDANALFRKNPKLEEEYFDDTWHPNKRGNLVLAEWLADLIGPEIGGGRSDAAAEQADAASMRRPTGKTAYNDPVR